MCFDLFWFDFFHDQVYKNKANKIFGPKKINGQSDSIINLVFKKVKLTFKSLKWRLSLKVKVWQNFH